MNNETPDEKLIFTLMSLLSLRIANDNNILDMDSDDRERWYEASRETLALGAKRLGIEPPTVQ